MKKLGKQRVFAYTYQLRKKHKIMSQHVTRFSNIKIVMIRD